MKLDQAACLHALQLILIFAAVVTLGIITQNPLTMFGFLLMWSSPPVFIPKQEDEEEEVKTSRKIGFVTDATGDDQ